MAKLAQFGIAAALLGLVITFMGLFPGVVGLEQSPGVGVLQIMVILTGISIMMIGAYVFVQANYYPGKKHNLAQQIAIRLSMTGMVLSTASGLVDILGFGSHQPGVTAQRPYLGPIQTIGIIGGFLIASFGVIIFTLMGDNEDENS